VGVIVNVRDVPEISCKKQNKFISVWYIYHSNFLFRIFDPRSLYLIPRSKCLLTEREREGGRGRERYEFITENSYFEEDGQSRVMKFENETFSWEWGKINNPGVSFS
jgi:hypothetical protein